ncbi:MAG TPA: CopD family protein, partial [Candidatus Cybelea sp.]|nr:CopD family protein [Candidatus Cybelea sp.]
LVLGLALVLSLAWAGHAAAVEGASGWVLLVSQLVHLAASAGWLGSLLPLAMVLSRARRRPASWGFAAAVTRRFSPVGQVCVAALVVSGIANGLVLVGTVPALVGTHYGRLLLAKLAFFAFMCLLAAANRFRLTPALDMRPGRAVRGLWRNALLEIALGIGVLGIVGALGASTPAAHDQPVWPFPVAFSLQALDQDQTLLVPLALTGLLAALALAAVCFGWLKRHPAVAGVGLGGLGAAIVVAAQLSAVPAYPTSFQHSPLRYTARAVAAGGHTYATFCTACHGEAGHGDGSAAASLSIKPANLTEPHLFHHGEGTLFWWIGHGIANTPMPGFADQIDETKRWELIQFLRANAEAEEASSLTASVDPPSTVVAPDFEFQIAKGPQETLKDLRGGTNVLLVFYSLPASRDRLTALAAAASDLAQQHLRIVAVPMSEAGQAPPSVPFATDAAPEIVAAYALYRRGNPAASAAPPPHEEFLIDRAGYLRARWTLGAADGWGDLARLKDALVQLNAERPRPPAPEGHVHG